VLPRRSTLIFAALVALTSATTACGVSSRTFPSVLPTNGQQSEILADDGSVITTLAGDQDREPISLDQIPVLLQNAVIAIEDQRFWDHNGIDPRGILRAAKANSSAGGVSQGGSTITQQYVRAVLLTPKRTFQRKIEEASLALQMERSYSKKYILEQYLNTIYFGNRAYGVEVAAKTYFGYGVDDPTHPLSLPQAALLAAILNGPTVFDPYKHADLAIKRRNLVLTKMAQLGYITPSQESDAEATPIGVVPKGSSNATPQTYPAAHFVDEVKRFIRTDKAFGATEADRDDLLANGGLRIYTTVDLTMQAQAEAAVKQVYPNQARAITDPRKDPDVGLVALDPRTGYVKAMVGGYNFFDTNNAIHSYAQVNLADSGRQVGSTFKPIALAAAVSNGIKMSDVYPSPGATVIRIPGYPAWTVSGDALGRASLTQCVIHSANTCFANLMADKRVLPPRVAQYAAMMGIDTNPAHGFDVVPSEVLGTNNTTVLQMTGAYDTFDNNGIFVPPVLVTKVVRADGTVVYQNAHTQRKVLEPDQAASITSALEGVLTSGTAAGRGIGRPAAGKTGTTQGNTDAWFIGYTPQLVTGVWTGYATPLSTRRGAIGRLRQLPGVGAKMAAPVWQAFMKVALANVPPTDFTAPTGATPGSTTTTVPKGNQDIFQLESGAPKLVTMPALAPGNTNDASAKAKRQGLHLRRVDATGAPGTLPGQVLAQSPAAGSKVPSDSDVTIEATPGNPPPTAPIPDVTGQLLAAGQSALTTGGWTIASVLTNAPPPGYLLANGQVPASGQIWSISPAVGTVSPDGNLTLSVVP
jgi:penicillin-binding protein 1A